MSLGLESGAMFAGYRIEARLGQGGMGVVYLAWDPKLERRVALKILSQALADDARFRQRFIHESKRAASLGHPNVIPVFEAGEAEGVLYLAMQYVQGVDLKALLEREGPLDTARTLSIVRQVARALDAARTKDLVHRDVKPANIMIVPRGESEAEDQVYLLDFGLTKQAGSDSGLTRTGQFVGTLDYVAPEQIEGKDVDGRADVYALGCVLYECLTGSRPYPKANDAAVIYAHLTEPAPAVTLTRQDLSSAINQVVAKAMAKSREARYPSAGALAAAVATALKGEPVPGDSPRVLSAPPPQSPATTLPESPGHTATPSTNLSRSGVHTDAPPSGTKQSRSSQQPVDQTVAQPFMGTAPALPTPMNKPIRRRRHLRALVVLLILLATIVTIAVIAAIAATTQQGQFTTVADVAGADGTAAVDRLSAASLKPEPITEANCAVASGRVIRTEPAAGSKVQVASAIHVIVSGGPDVTVPNLVALDRRDAEAKLQSLHLRSAASTEDSNDMPVGQVIRADPGAGARVCSGSVVGVVVSKDISFIAPTDVVRAYIQAINRKDYTTAYSFLGPAFRSRQTQEAFTAGFADTTFDQVLELSDSGTNPNGTSVTIRFVAHHVDGSTRAFAGTYTVARIDSRWALVGASLTQQ